MRSDNTGSADPAGRSAGIGAIAEDSFLALGFALDLRGLFGGAEIVGKGRCRKRSQIARHGLAAAGGTSRFLSFRAFLICALNNLSMLCGAIEAVCCCG